VQTFLPYTSFEQTMRVLDPKRLGNQIYREALTLVRGGWSSHPASLMWKGYEWHLCDYALAGLRELHLRKAIKQDRIFAHVHTFREIQKQHEKTEVPYWLGNEDFHASHRSNLLRKDPVYYGQFGWAEPDDLPYVWPKPREDIDV